jgi:hypothetical protein
MQAAKNALSLAFALTVGFSLAAQSLPEWQRKLKPPGQAANWSAPVLPALFRQPQRQAAPSLYDFRELAPFCKLDVKLEQTFKLPVKFRLGEVQYVDRLEQKGPTTVPSFP